MSKYSLGLDFGSLSVRALIVEMRTGKEIISTESKYTNGIMDAFLLSGKPLGVDWALQVPKDYEDSMSEAIQSVLKQSKINKDEIAGIGVDFTSCTVMPVMADGTPMCNLPQYRNEPHAYVKLWMHHAAAKEAERINEVGRKYARKWIDRYSGRISSEFLLPKVLQIINEAPEIYESFDLFMEAGDWLVWRMTGNLFRNACAAGYKAMWHAQDGYPSKEFFRNLDERIENIVEEKLYGNVMPVGSVAGELTQEYAEKMGLLAGTPVAVCTVDGHCTYASLGIDIPGTLMIIMGTSGCHLTIFDKEINVPGMCGVVLDGVLPGYYGYESGQAGFGTHMAWFIENCVPATYMQEAEARGIQTIQLLTEKAERLQPGENGVIGLDWWNGNRSVLNNQNLSGMLVGLTYQTKPEDIYRALLEAIAFGTKRIVESFENSGIPVSRISAVGGIPEKNSLLMQICADVLGRPIQLAGSKQGAALGAAIYGAKAAGSINGGYDDILLAVRRMGKLKDVVYRPNPSSMVAYEDIYNDYCRLYNWFGSNSLMAQIKDRKRFLLSSRIIRD